MTTAWNHLPNATHTTRIVESMNADMSVWDAASNASKLALGNKTFWRAARNVANNAPCPKQWMM